MLGRQRKDGTSIKRKEGLLEEKQRAEMGLQNGRYN